MSEWTVVHGKESDWLLVDTGKPKPFICFPYSKVRAIFLRERCAEHNALAKIKEELDASQSTCPDDMCGHMQVMIDLMDELAKGEG